MILLDTNVVSEVMLPAPSRQVLQWLDDQETSGLYLSTITLAEIGFGLATLPAGKKHLDLQGRFESFVSLGFEQRILSFDKTAAMRYGEIMAHRKSLGRPMSTLDGQIAAIAQTRHLSLATPNRRDFEGCGLVLVDPFIT